MAAPPRSRSKSPPITLDDVDASLEPVAPEELEEDFHALEDEAARATSAEAGLGAGPPRRSDSMELLPSAEPVDQPRGVAGARHPVPRRAPAEWDPWLNDRSAMTWRQTVLAVVVVPPRIVMCLAMAAVLMPLSIALMALATATPHAWRGPRLRAAVVLPVRLLCRIGLLGAGFWRITTRGSYEPGRGGAHIVVCNHCSVGDVLFAVYYLAPAFLAKAEATRIPYIGAAAAALGCVLVDRRSAESRAAARNAIAERAAARDPTAPPLLIFPEGTTTNGLCLLAWERGAFNPGRAVVPMAIAYPKGQPKPDALFSVETLRAFARPKNSMLVTFLPPLVPDVAEAADAAAFAAAARALVACALDLPVCERTFREGLHRKRREAPPASDAALRALHDALPPRQFRDECCACGGADGRVEPRSYVR